MNNKKEKNNPIFEISSKIGDTYGSRSKEGSTEGSNTLQDMLNIILQDNNTDE